MLACMQQASPPSSDVEASWPSLRLFIAVTLAVQLLWLGHTILRLYQTAPYLEKGFVGAPATASFLACYRWAPLLLAILCGLSIDVVRRRSVSQLYAMVVFSGISATIWASLTWFFLALYEPARRIADAIRY